MGVMPCGRDGNEGGREMYAAAWRGGREGREQRRLYGAAVGSVVFQAPPLPVN